MAKYNIKKGDKITARTSAVIDENAPYKKIGGHNTYKKSLTVTKVFSHGVSTKERGYVNNNNILKPNHE